MAPMEFPHDSLQERLKNLDLVLHGLRETAEQLRLSPGTDERDTFIRMNSQSITMLERCRADLCAGKVRAPRVA